MFLRKGPFALMLSMVIGMMPLSGQGVLDLEVVNPSATPMVQAPVTLGVPLPELPFAVRDLSDFHITVVDPTGNPVPCQFRNLSRWHGTREDQSRSLKWVQVTFLADCAAQGSVTYGLRVGWRPAGQLVAQDTSGAFIISPLPGTTFEIDKNTFSIFRSAVVDGETVVQSPGGELVVMDQNQAQVAPVLSETVFEDVGSVRAVVRQRGTLGALSFTCRYYFHSGRRDVAVDFRLENYGAYGVFFNPSSHQYFDSLYLKLPLAGGTSSVTTPSGTYSSSNGTYEIHQSYAWLEQLDLLNNFNYAETSGGTSVGTGRRFDGSVDVMGPSAGVAVTVERFWQNYPKALRVDAGTLQVGLWPEWGNGPEYRGVYGSLNGPEPIDPMALTNYRFEGGRWKTHRVVFDFHRNLKTPSEVVREAERVNRPAAARPPGWWVKHTRATGMLVNEVRAWGDPSLQRLERMYNMLADDNAADHQTSLGRIGYHAFVNRGGTYGGNPFFGWENYGDIFWSSGASSLHYDWPMSVLLQWYRGGSYECFDIGRDMLHHRRDYDQNHSRDPAEFWRGATFYEKGWWHGNYYIGEVSHTWIHGVLLHYAMTGDESSYEAAQETANYLVRNTPAAWTGEWGSRRPGWTILNLADAYNYLGRVDCIAEARGGMDTFEVLESQNGGLGYVLNPLATPANYCKPWQHCIVLTAAVRYVMATGDTTHLPLIRRMRDFIRDTAIVKGHGDFTHLTMPYMWEEWSPTGTQYQSVHHLWFALDSLCHTYMLFQEPTDLVFATCLFEVLTRFYQVSPGTVVNTLDSGSYSPIAMRMIGYPGTESKILGNILRSSFSYPAIRTWVNGNF